METIFLIIIIEIAVNTATANATVTPTITATATATTATYVYPTTLRVAIICTTTCNLTKDAAVATCTVINNIIYFRKLFF